jgi:hypothetical protein
VTKASDSGELYKEEIEEKLQDLEDCVSLEAYPQKSR